MKKILYILPLLTIPYSLNAQNLNEIKIPGSLETLEKLPIEPIVGMEISHINSCRTHSVAFINYPQTVPTQMGATDITSVLEIIPSLTLTEDNKQAIGPIAGFEGHNFIEDPAIIYPNPVKDIMEVKSTDPITVIEILNAQGQLETQLDPRMLMIVSDLAAGTYYARIYFENRTDVQVEKILIIK